MRPKTTAAALTSLGDADRVLEQAAAVGVVVVLRRGRLAVGLPGRRRGVEQRGEQRERCGSSMEATSASRSSHSSLIGRSGPSSSSSQAIASAARPAQRLDRHLTSVARMLGETTGDVDGVADLDRRRLAGVPQDGGDAARAVGERRLTYGAPSRFWRRSIARTSSTASTALPSCRSRTGVGARVITDMVASRSPTTEPDTPIVIDRRMR